MSEGQWFRHHPGDGRPQFRAYDLLFDIDFPYNVTFKYSWPLLREAGVSGCGDCCEGMRAAVMEPGARLRRGFVPLPFSLVPWDLRRRLHGHYYRRHRGWIASQGYAPWPLADPPAGSEPVEKP